MITLEGLRVSSKIPSRIQVGDEGVAGRNGREKCFPDEHEGRIEGFVTAAKYFCDSTVNRKMSSYEALTFSDVLILIVKVKLNVLDKAVYMARSIRPNKAVKIAVEN